MAGTPKYLIDYTIPDYYKWYYENSEYPLFKTAFSESKDIRISKELYTKIIKDFFKLMLEKLPYEPEGFRLPARLGVLQVMKVMTPFDKYDPKGKNNKLKMDYKYYNETGKKIYYTNDKTGGYYCRWCWNRGKHNIPMLGQYKWLPLREKKREIGKLFAEGKIDFFVSPNTAKLKFKN